MRNEWFEQFVLYGRECEIAWKVELETILQILKTIC